MSAWPFCGACGYGPFENVKISRGAAAKSKRLHASRERFLQFCDELNKKATSAEGLFVVARPGEFPVSWILVGFSSEFSRVVGLGGRALWRQTRLHGLNSQPSTIQESPSSAGSEVTASRVKNQNAQIVESGPVSSATVIITFINSMRNVYTMLSAVAID